MFLSPIFTTFNVDPKATDGLIFNGVDKYRTHYKEIAASQSAMRKVDLILSLEARVVDFLNALGD